MIFKNVFFTRITYYDFVLILFQVENDINYHVSSQMILCATSAFDLHNIVVAIRVLIWS